MSREFTARELSAALARLAEAAGRGERCPPPEQIWDSAREMLPGRADRLVVAHIAECTACAAAWRIARDLAGRPVEPEILALPSRPARRIWAPLGAAAAMVIAVGGAGLYLLSRDAGRAPVFRAQQEDWIQPVAERAAPLPRGKFILRWTAGPEGTTFDIRVTTERLALLACSRGLDRPEFWVPKEALDPIPPGSRVFWQVTAYLPDGHRSDSATFVTLVE